MWFGGLRRAGLDSVSVSLPLSLSFSLSRPGVSPGALLPWLVARVTGNDRVGCCIATARASRDENDNRQTDNKREVSTLEEKNNGSTSNSTSRTWLRADGRTGTMSTTTTPVTTLSQACSLD